MAMVVYWVVRYADWQVFGHKLFKGAFWEER